MSENVELNPGPMKKCPKCKKMMSTRSNNCKCGYLLCYVSARVLHSSTFIFIATFNDKILVPSTFFSPYLLFGRPALEC